MALALAIEGGKACLQRCEIGFRNAMTRVRCNRKRLPGKRELSKGYIWRIQIPYVQSKHPGDAFSIFERANIVR